MHEYKVSDDMTVIVEMDGHDAVVSTSDGDEVGRFKFREIEYDYGPTTHSYLHLCHMDLHGYKGLGIGRFCLQVVTQETGMVITASDPSDLQEKDDGSHLIGDGPGFVRAMQREGLIAGGGED